MASIFGAPWKTVLKSDAAVVVENDYTVYDAYIDSLGVLFYGGSKPSTRSLPLRPVRQDVGNNPFEQRPESGDIFAQGEFSNGSGQEFFHRPGRDERKFLSSEGFDISNRGKLTHLYRSTLVPNASVTTAATAMAQVGDKVLVFDGSVVKRADTFPTGWDTEVVAGVTGYDIVAAGAEAFAGVNSTTGPLWKRDSSGTWAVYQLSLIHI